MAGAKHEKPEAGCWVGWSAPSLGASRDETSSGIGWGDKLACGSAASYAVAAVAAAMYEALLGVDGLPTAPASSFKPSQWSGEHCRLQVASKCGLHGVAGYADQASRNSFVSAAI